MDGDQATVIATVARPPDGTLIAFCANHAFPRLPISTEKLLLTIESVADPVAVFVTRIDKELANPKRAGQVMGSPPHPSIDQVHRLRSASEMQVEPTGRRRSDGDVVEEFELPSRAVAAATLRF